MNSETPNNINRRNFVKAAGAFAVTGGQLSAKADTLSDEIPTFIQADAHMEYHICQGLNMKTENHKDATGTEVSYSPGKAPTAKLANTSDLHSCEGGNTCAGLGACGTGDYGRQYWVTDNTCGKETSGSKWNGNGGCGVPIGTGNTGYIHTQLNSAAPTEDTSSTPANQMYPADFVGRSIWSIARSRFEAKMVSLNKGFGLPDTLDSSDGTKSWAPGSTYTRPSCLPAPYPKPWPPRATASNPPVQETK